MSLGTASATNRTRLNKGWTDKTFESPRSQVGTQLKLSKIKYYPGDNTSKLYFICIEVRNQALEIADHFSRTLSSMQVRTCRLFEEERTNRTEESRLSFLGSQFLFKRKNGFNVSPQLESRQTPAVTPAGVPCGLVAKSTADKSARSRKRLSEKCRLRSNRQCHRLPRIRQRSRRPAAWVRGSPTFLFLGCRLRSA